MSGVPLKVKPGRSIPDDVDFTFRMKPVVVPGEAAAPPSACTKGICAGIGAPDGTVIANDSSITVLRVIPTASPAPVLPTCWTDADVEWIVNQFQGGPRTPTVTALGASWRDGIQLEFNPGTDGGLYGGTGFLVYPRIPFPLLGESGTLAICGQITLTSDPSPDIVCISFECFESDGSTPLPCEPDAGCAPYEAHTGAESGGLPIRIVVEAVGFPSGSVTWEFDNAIDPVYGYGVTFSGNQITLDLTFAGGSNPDVVRFRAVDLFDSGITAPPVPPDDDGWFLVTQ